MAPSLATIIIIIRVVALASISLVVYAQQLAVVETRVSRNRSTTIEVVAQPPSSPYSYVSVEGPQGLQSVLSHLNLTGSEVLTRHQGLWVSNPPPFQDFCFFWERDDLFSLDFYHTKDALLG